MSKLLTHDMLDEMGITIFEDSTAECGYRIFHTTRAGQQEIKPKIVSVYHRWSGKTKSYYNISWSNYAKEKKAATYSLARVIYAWYRGEVPADMDCDHIDDNPFNNKLENLQLLTRAENLQKRALNGINQWAYKNKDEKKS